MAPAEKGGNPDLSPRTHARTDTAIKGVKVGLDSDTIRAGAQTALARPHVRVVGLHMHFGSSILSARLSPGRSGAIEESGGKRFIRRGFS